MVVVVVVVDREGMMMMIFLSFHHFYGIYSIWKEEEEEGEEGIIIEIEVGVNDKGGSIQLSSQRGIMVAVIIQMIVKRRNMFTLVRVGVLLASVWMFRVISGDVWVSRPDVLLIVTSILDSSQTH